MYCHSVESRTYAACINTVLAPGAAAAPALARRHLTPRDARYDIRNAVEQAAIHFQDSYDTANLDSQYSLYRGQQKAFIRPVIADAAELRSWLGNGGLVNGLNINTGNAKKGDDLAKKAVKEAEAKAIQSNKAQQAALDAARPAGAPKTCFEGVQNFIVNNPDCNRQYTTTYVSNVDYKAIVNALVPQFKALGLQQYTAKLKDVTQGGCTPDNPFPLKKNGKAFKPAGYTGTCNGLAPAAPKPAAPGTVPPSVVTILPNPSGPRTAAVGTGTLLSPRAGTTPPPITLPAPANAAPKCNIK
jgi:hypothetical protein